MDASATRAGQAMCGLMLCGALLPGCPSGDKADACTSDEVSYGVTLVAGDEFTESVKDEFDDLMTVGIERAYEAPDLLYDCLSTASKYNYDDLAERVVTTWASFDQELEFEVPAGWLCAWMSGGIDGQDPGTYIRCYGSEDFSEVQPCERANTMLIVTCWAGTVSTEEDGWSDVSQESGEAPR